MRIHLLEHLHPRFQKLIANEAIARNIVDDIEGKTRDEWFELRGQMKLLCRLKKPAVEAAIPRIRNTILQIGDKKLRDACSQLAGQYVAIIVREELGGHNSGTKNRVSELFTRAEVFVDPMEPGKPRKPRGVFRRAFKTSELDAAFITALNASQPPPETAEFDTEVDVPQ